MRTKIGESAMQVAPTSSAGRAGRTARDGARPAYFKSFQRFIAAS